MMTGKCGIISGGSIPVSTQTLTLDLPVCLGITCIAMIPPLFRKKFEPWQGIVGIILYAAYIAYVCFFTA